MSLSFREPLWLLICCLTLHTIVCDVARKLTATKLFPFGSSEYLFFACFLLHYFFALSPQLWMHSGKKAARMSFFTGCHLNMWPPEVWTRVLSQGSLFSADDRLTQQRLKLLSLYLVPISSHKCMLFVEMPPFSVISCLWKEFPWSWFNLLPSQCSSFYLAECIRKRAVQNQGLWCHYPQCIGGIAVQGEASHCGVGIGSSARRVWLECITSFLHAATGNQSMLPFLSLPPDNLPVPWCGYDSAQSWYWWRRNAYVVRNLTSDDKVS